MAKATTTTPAPAPSPALADAAPVQAAATQVDAAAAAGPAVGIARSPFVRVKVTAAHPIFESERHAPGEEFVTTRERAEALAHCVEILGDHTEAEASA